MYIVNYHNVLFERPDAFDLRLPRISQSQFDEEIKYLIKNFDVVSTNDIVKEINLPSNSIKEKVAITFDDGCLGVLKYAVPILKKYNVHATMYVITDFINRHNEYFYFDSIELAFRLTKIKKIDLSFLDLGFPSIKTIESKIKYMKYVKRKLKINESEDRKKNTQMILDMLGVEHNAMIDYMIGKEKYLFMSWDDLTYLKEIGFEIGSHTHTHPTLSKVTLDTVEEELSKSYSIIKDKLGLNSISFAYPHGNIQHIGTETPIVVEKIGYSFALTTIPNKVSESTNKFLINRVTFEELRQLTKNNKIFI